MPVVPHLNRKFLNAHDAGPDVFVRVHQVVFCDASIRDSLPAEQYSLIMLTVVPSIFSRNKTAAEIPRYSHASFKIS